MSTEPKETPKNVAEKTGIQISPEQRRRETTSYVIMLAGIYIALVLIALILTIFETKVNGTTINIGKAMLLLLIPYTLLSIRKVDGDEIAAVLFFGKPLKNFNSGPVLVPLSICQLAVETKNRIQTEHPGEPEQIVRDDNVPLEHGKVRPIRIPTASKETCSVGPFEDDPRNPRGLEDYNEMKKDFEDETRIKILSKDPLHDRLTLEPPFVSRIRIKDMVQFIQVIGSVSEAVRQIEDTIVTRAQAEFGRRTPALIVKHFDYINRRIHHDLEVLIGEKSDKYGNFRDPWGIDLADGHIKQVGFTESINKAIAARGAAAINRYSTAQVGIGEGEATEGRLVGEARGLAEMAKTLESEHARFALSMKTVEKTISPTAQTIITNGAGGEQLATMFGGAVGAASAIANRPVPTPTPPKNESKTEQKKKE